MRRRPATSCSRSCRWPDGRASPAPSGPLRASTALEPDREAVDRLADAVAVLESSPVILLRARLLEMGKALRRLGRRVEAPEPLRQALEIAAACGAVPVADRAREEAILAAARPGRPRLRGGRAHARRVADRPAGRRGPYEPRDRGGAVPYGQDGRRSPWRCLRQARHDRSLIPRRGPGSAGHVPSSGVRPTTTSSTNISRPLPAPAPPPSAR
jgi:hypothetical protein